jgi:hypothetical protein
MRGVTVAFVPYASTQHALTTAEFGVLRAWPLWNPMGALHIISLQLIASLRHDSCANRAPDR